MVCVLHQQRLQSDWNWLPEGTLLDLSQAIEGLGWDEITPQLL